MTMADPGGAQPPPPAEPLTAPAPPVAPAPAVAPAQAAPSPAPATQAPAMPAINLRASDFKFTPASIAMIAGGAITVVGYLLPWATMTGSVLGQSLGSTVAGSDFLIVVIGLALVVGGLAFAYRTQQFKIAWVAV